MFVRWAKMIVDDSSEDEPLMASSDAPLWVPAQRNVFFCAWRPLSHSKAKVGGNSSVADTAAKRSHILPPVAHLHYGTVA